MGLFNDRTFSFKKNSHTMLREKGDIQMYNHHIRQPIFTQLEPQRLQQILYQTIIDKTESVELYTRLLNQSPNEFVFRLLENIRFREANSLSQIRDLYTQNYGNITEFTITPILFSDFEEGILLAIEKETRLLDDARNFLSLADENQPGYEFIQSVILLDIEDLVSLGIIYSSI